MSQPRFATVPPAPPPPMAGPAWSSYAHVELQAARDSYLRQWQIVKRARFNASKRLERKQTASTLAFAIAGTIGFVVPFVTLTLADAIPPDIKKILELVAYFIGALSVSVGLVEQARNYPLLARRYDVCGRKVNAVLRRLKNNPAPDPRFLDELVAHYEAALDECEANHDDIDREIAVAQEAVDAARASSQPRGGAHDPALNAAHPLGQPGTSGAAEAQRALRKARLKENVQIYWLYWLIWLAPAVLGALVWVVVGG